MKDHSQNSTKLRLNLTLTSVRVVTSCSVLSSERAWATWIIGSDEAEEDTADDNDADAKVKADAKAEANANADAAACVDDDHCLPKLPCTQPNTFGLKINNFRSEADEIQCLRAEIP